MGRNERIAFAAIAAVIAVVAVVLISGGEDERTERADATPAAAAATETATAATEAATPEATPTPKPKPKAELVRFRDGEVVGGPQRLRFEKGETARFAIASDTADEVHVHGYDLHEDVPAGGRVSFAFKADIEGIFEVELEGLGTEVAQLRVEP